MADFPPTATGLYVSGDPEMEIIYATDILESQAGTEIRTQWHSSGRRRFRYRLVGAGATATTAMEDIWTDHGGELQTVTVDDPLHAGITATCRFDGPPKFRQYRGIPGWWEGEYTLIEVI
jgi:hypothetical protein